MFIATTNLPYPAAHTHNPLRAGCGMARSLGSARRLHGVRIVLKNKFSSDCGARVDLRPFIRAVATAALASQWGGLLYAGGASRSSALDSIYG